MDSAKRAVQENAGPLDREQPRIVRRDTDLDSDAF
jgi:hypothetical protein